MCNVVEVGQTECDGCQRGKGEMQLTVLTCVKACSISHSLQSFISMKTYLKGEDLQLHFLHFI